MSGSQTLRELFERGMRPFFIPPNRAEAVAALPRSLHDFTDVYSAFLECRIGDASGPVDFAWTQFRRDFAVPAALAGEEPWQTMARFGERWHADDATFRSIACIVYEIDQDGAHFETTPSIFFNRMKAEAPVVAAVHHATSNLLARPPSRKTEVMFRRVLDAMPPSAIVLCLGYMLSRPATPMRFEISQIEPHRALSAYLRAIGWPGDDRQVAHVIAALPRLAKDFHVGLAFDVADEVGPRLGLEFVFKNGADREAALAGALDDLMSAGLCAQGWPEALAIWTGEPPPEVGWMRAFLPPASGYRRIVSHFKIVLGGPAIEAKCYLECLPAAMLDASRWRDPPSSRAAMMTGTA